MSETFVCLIYIFGVLQGFCLGMGFAKDGKSPFWTGFIDTVTLRVLWRKY